MNRLILEQQVRLLRRSVANRRCGHGACWRTCERLVVITVAFNNSAVVFEQARRLQRYLLDDFDWFVVDNSTELQARRDVADAAALGGAVYVALTRTPYRVPGSPSHGFALDVAWRSLVRGSGRSHVAVLDHDVFPVRPTSLMACLGEGAVSGVLQTRGERWYVWPGLLVMDVSQFDPARVTFMPGGGVDTGGWVPDALRGDKSRRRLAAMGALDVRVRETDGSLQSDYVTVVGDWLHLVNASGWCDVPDVEGRAAAISEFVESFGRSAGSPSDP